MSYQVSAMSCQLSAFGGLDVLPGPDSPGVWNYCMQGSARAPERAQGHKLLADS